MNRFLLRLATVLLAAGATYAVLLYAGFTDPLEAGAVQRDKIARLEGLGSPKVAIVGGSNVMFGIDSGRLQRTLKMPVVNTGVNAGISLNYMLEVVRPRLGSGDVVVLALEHGAFYADPFDVTDATLEVLAHDPGGPRYLESVGGMTLGRVKRLLASNSRIIGYFDNRLRPLFPFLPQRIYRRASFDEHGDVVAHLGRVSLHPAVAPGGGPKGAVRGDVVRLLEGFVRDACSRGASVVFSWPSIMRSQYMHDRADIEATFAAVRGSAVIGTRTVPADYVLDDSYFYDTPWHLGAAGRQLRTARLEAEVASELAARQAGSSGCADLR